MCPHQNGDSTPNDPSQMVAVDLTNGSSSHTSSISANGVNGHANGANGHAALNGTNKYQEQQRRNPYAPRASDFLSNVSNFKIIESTLRGTSTNVTCSAKQLVVGF